jgi:DNA processing protein
MAWEKAETVATAVEDEREYLACLALRNADGIGPKTWKRLLEHYPTPDAAVSDARAWSRLGLVPESKATAFQGGNWREKADKEALLAQACDCKPLLWTDALYPELLRQIPSPPLLLYHMGDLTLLSNPGVAVVGSRKCTRYGRDVTTAVAGELARCGVTVVSGMAWGIDREAHLAALEGVGSSIAVMGTGLDIIYPKDNRDVWRLLADKGLILSEYGPGSKPTPHHFPQRNRIIAGLSLGVAVAEAGLRSGALITARMAMEFGREVYAVPGPMNASSQAGCHKLIREGAKLVDSAWDILEDLAPLLHSHGVSEDYSGRKAPASAPMPKERTTQAAPTRQRKEIPEGDEGVLMTAFSEGEKMHIDALGRAVGWEMGRVSSVLLLLEMRGLVRQWPGMVYSVT